MIMASRNGGDTSVGHVEILACEENSDESPSLSIQQTECIITDEAQTDGWVKAVHDKVKCMDSRKDAIKSCQVYMALLSAL
ncbi:unnamed protein product [Toxocara canis]|uniref:Retrovirus-related Pol polyprotein from transposon TNT 1-94 n=1 Tax=Toxocara canis TaxID=6265 RepID=A0A183U6T7_TOXCA|nr:unnamed protein product [Toxocara canis]